MPTHQKIISCPTCGKKDTWVAENNFRPFCSERCKLIDLGSWADESYHVTGEKVDPNASTPNDEDKSD